MPPFLQDVRDNYVPGPVLGRGAFGVVIGCVDRTTRERFACKSLNVAELLESRDGPHAVRRLRNEINIMSYLVGHPHVRPPPPLHPRCPSRIRNALLASMRHVASSPRFPLTPHLASF